MSWISENYEKAALGAAAVVALGLAFAGWQSVNGVEENFSSLPSGGGKNDPSVQQADEVSTAISSFKLPRQWSKGDDEGRPVDLFTGVALFVNKNNLEIPVDLIDGEPVHPPIPNQWWIDNRIDPGFGDSALRDADEDGFSNLEEFEGKTDPNDPSSYPALITKLAYVGEEAVQWVLRPVFPSGDAYTFEYSDTANGSNKTGAGNPLAPGSLLFEEQPAMNRFKYLGSEKRKEMNETYKTEMDVTIVKVEDMRPNKAGTLYEIPGGFRKPDARKYAHYDRTAILTLDALGMAGQEIKVEENTSFALPPNAPKKDFRVTSITPEMVTIEYPDADGTRKTVDFSMTAEGTAAEEAVVE